MIVSEQRIKVNEARFTQPELCAAASIDMATANNWIQRRILEPDDVGGRKLQGRRLFSIATILKAKLIGDLVNRLAMSPSEAAAVAEIAAGGNWMWTCARALDTNQDRTIYAYATRIDGKWQFDMRIEDYGATPCFGWRAVQLCVPMSEIFGSVYAACNKILSEPELSIRTEE